MKKKRISWESSEPACIFTQAHLLLIKVHHQLYMHRESRMYLLRYL